MTWPILEARAEIQKKIVCFLVQVTTSKFAFEINWPLVKSESPRTYLCSKLHNMTYIIFVVPQLELPPPELTCHPSFPPNNGQTSFKKSSDYTLLNPKKIILCFWLTVKEWEFVERHLISLQLVHQQWLLRYVVHTLYLGLGM